MADPMTDPVAGPQAAANGGPPLRALPADVAEVVFEILVCVMWSDGELVSDEVERGRAAAEVMCVRPSRGGALGAIADGPLLFPAVAFEKLDGYSRRLAYGAACWLDDASPDPSERRRSFIAALRTKLDLDDATVHNLRTLASLAAGHEPRTAFALLMRGIEG